MTIFLLIQSIFLILSVIYIFFLRKKLSQSNHQIFMNKVATIRDFDRDTKFLNEVIENEINFSLGVVIPSFEIKQGGAIITNERYDELIKNSVNNITMNLSDDYKEILSFYFLDLDSYLISRLASKYQPFIINLNTRKVNNINLSKTFEEKEKK